MFGLTADEAKALSIDFHEFRERLSDQGLRYRPVHKSCPGDEAMREYTSANKKRRAAASVMTNATKKTKKKAKAAPESVVDAGVNRPTLAQFNRAKKDASGRDSIKTRLCGDITKIFHHIDRQH